VIQVTRNRGSALDSLLGMSREIDRLAGSMWPDVENGTIPVMPAEVVETDDEIRFEVEMPGFRQDDIDITLENNVLTIAGEKKVQRAEGSKDTDYRLFERRYGRYQRSFTVSPAVRGENCQASYADGVLVVRLPKSEDAKPRRIRVSTNGDPGRNIESGQG
jgi:HSP20 family protein